MDVCVYQKEQLLYHSHITSSTCPWNLPDTYPDKKRIDCDKKRSHLTNFAILHRELCFIMVLISHKTGTISVGTYQRKP